MVQWLTFREYGDEPLGPTKQNSLITRVRWNFPMELGLIPWLWVLIAKNKWHWSRKCIVIAHALWPGPHERWWRHDIKKHVHFAGYMNLSTSRFIVPPQIEMRASASFNIYACTWKQRVRGTNELSRHRTIIFQSILSDKAIWCTGIALH